MTEHTIFHEIQEDLERQKLAAWWKRYGIWVAATALGIVLATAATTAYHSWKADRDQRLTAGLVTAEKPGATTVKSLDALQSFADDHKGAGQADIALLRAGAVAAEQNDTPKAMKFFDQVANDPKADPAFRQLGDLLSVQVQMDWGDAAALALRLQPLTAENAPWRFSALEAQGYLAIRTGDTAKAKQIFTDLSQDARAPKTMGTRAADVLRGLN
jgi:hypothetical protein